MFFSSIDYGIAIITPYGINHRDFDMMEIIIQHMPRDYLCWEKDCDLVVHIYRLNSDEVSMLPYHQSGSQLSDSEHWKLFSPTLFLYTDILKRNVITLLLAIRLWTAFPHTVKPVNQIASHILTRVLHLVSTQRNLVMTWDENNLTPTRILDTQFYTGGMMKHSRRDLKDSPLDSFLFRKYARDHPKKCNTHELFPHHRPFDISI